MAYMNQELKKKIAEKIKAQYKGKAKFTFGVEHYSAIVVKIKEAPGFTTEDNSFAKDLTKEQNEFITKLEDDVKSAGGWYDNSDHMTDYFDTAFYVSVRVDIK